MRDKAVIIAVVVVVALAIAIISYPEAAGAILVVVVGSGFFLAIYGRYIDQTDFIVKVFFWGLFFRLLFGIFVHVYDLRGFFGGDAVTYDFNGNVLTNYWFDGPKSLAYELTKASKVSGSGWGMNYLVGGLYSIMGRNILAAQSFCAVVGAATAPMVFICAKKIFGNDRVAKGAALATALLPAMVIWSGQLLKDGLILFLLVLAMTMILHIQEKMNYGAVALLAFSILGIMSLRFYIFYMVAIAIAGSFFVGVTNSGKSLLTRLVALTAVGMTLTYFGVGSMATSDVNNFGDLKKLQISRSDQAKSADSGFGADEDVSTTEGAIAAIPKGLLYLFFAPFPWESRSVRSAITIPETLVWWAMIPFVFYGFWYAVRHRLRRALPIIIFTVMLTLVYSIFQGNVGTAYRQRTQIQVFMFIFAAVGLELAFEHRADAKRLNAERARRFQRNLAMER